MGPSCGYLEHAQTYTTKTCKLVECTHTWHLPIALGPRPCLLVPSLLPPTLPGPSLCCTSMRHLFAGWENQAKTENSSNNLFCTYDVPSALLSVTHGILHF